MMLDCINLVFINYYCLYTRRLAMSWDNKKMPMTATPTKQSIRIGRTRYTIRGRLHTPPIYKNTIPLNKFSSPKNLTPDCEERLWSVTQVVWSAGGQDSNCSRHTQ